MSDLQLALLALGAIIIAAVILFNWLQEARIRRETVRRFEGPVNDVLMVESGGFKPKPQPRYDEQENEEDIAPPVVIERFEQKIEHTISFEYIRDEAEETPEETITPDVAEEPEYKEPEAVTEKAEVSSEPYNEPEPEPDTSYSLPVQETVAEPATAETTIAAPVAASSISPPNVDEQIDFIAVMTLPQPCSGEKLREALLPLPQLDKSSQWIGLTIDGLWRHFTKDQEQTLFSQITGSLQLADRSGPASSSTISDFRRKAEEGANRLSASLEWRGQGNPQRYAQELDQFCIEVDVMVRLHLIAGPNGQFAGTKLRGLAEAGGMTLQEDGSFHYIDESSNETQFTLVNQAANPFTVEMLRTALIQSVTLQLDVTRVTNCPEVFSKMAMLAKRMEQGLNAILADDNRRTLGDAEIEKIRQQLKKIHTSMMAHYIIPGSPTALRLFS